MTRYDVLNKKGERIMRLGEESQAAEAAEHIGGSFVPVEVTPVAREVVLERAAEPAPIPQPSNTRYETVPNGWGGVTTRRKAQPAGNTATDRQMAFVKKLLDERKGNETAEELRRGLNAAFKAGALTKAVASGAIESLLKIEVPRKQAASTSTKRDIPDVPAGRYAFDTDAGHTGFCQVSRPQEGRWAGYTFVDLLLGSPGSLRREKIPFPQQVAILHKIVADPKAAMLRFGHELGTCGECGSPLTNDQSRKAGIGPVCANNKGW